jgi:hypothetical protein
MTTLKQESFEQTVEYVLMNAESLIFPVRKISQRRGLGGQPALHSITWHQVLPESMIRNVGDFSRSACGEADLANSEMPRRFRYKIAPAICAVCARRGELDEDAMRAEAERLIGLVRDRRNEKHRIRPV